MHFSRAGSTVYAITDRTDVSGDRPVGYKRVLFPVLENESLFALTFFVHDCHNLLSDLALVNFSQPMSHLTVDVMDTSILARSEHETSNSLPIDL